MDQRLFNSLSIIERMLFQNNYGETIDDYKYFEDAADTHRPNFEGSLMPLWKISSPLIKKMCITSISWNPMYKDLFAVGVGSSRKIPRVDDLFKCMQH